MPKVRKTSVFNGVQFSVKADRSAYRQGDEGLRPVARHNLVAV